MFKKGSVKLGKFLFMFLLIDKEKGVTSHDVIDEVRKVTGEKRVGHAGTLDPNATGLLIVGIGRESTKRLGGLTKDTRKTYEAEVFLGEERDTLDAEGVIISKTKNALPPGRKEVLKVLTSFMGKGKQVPPAHSALKVQGKKAYELARKGESVALKARDINIYTLELVSYEYPVLVIECTVSSGTYIRALARDIGKKLGIGAYLRNLRRTHIGSFSVEDAIKVDKLTKENWRRCIINL